MSERNGGGKDRIFLFDGSVIRGGKMIKKTPEAPYKP